MASVIIEAVACSVEDALIAEDCGVDRLELCSSLFNGGVTPSIGLVRQVVQRVRIPVVVLVRPRGGDFVYTMAELKTMTADVAALEQEGIAGVVTAALTESGEVDIPACRELVQSTELPCVFHRAFELVKDQHRASDTLMELGFKRVLTLVQQRGPVRFSLLHQHVRGGLEICLAGGLRSDNIREWLEQAPVEQVHLGPHVWADGRAERPERTSYQRIGEAELRRFVETVRSFN